MIRITLSEGVIQTTVPAPGNTGERMGFRDAFK